MSVDFNPSPRQRRVTKVYTSLKFNVGSSQCLFWGKRDKIFFGGLFCFVFRQLLRTCLSFSFVFVSETVLKFYKLTKNE